MTAEVAIMNQHALVLAADSATTVTMWVEGERETRYFKGANKLFQLSVKHPVGLMIYGSASLHETPWELLVKDFRATLGSESCEQLAGYAKKFFDFVKGHAKLFPDDLRKAMFKEEALRAAYKFAREAISKDEVVAAADADKTDLVRVALELTRDDLATATPQDPVTAADIESAIAAHADGVAEKIHSESGLFGLPSADLAPILAQIAVRELMSNYKQYLSETGVVIGGYGDDDYYPSYEAFECFGFLDRQFICNAQGKPQRVGKDLPAAIEAFATTSMINTFRMGIGPDVFGNVLRATRKELYDFATKLQGVLTPENTEPPAQLETLIDQAMESHKKEWFHRSVAEHYGPLARVIGSLPVSDMAALAKSLIELQSLKERVTKPTESVAGPIDVAVITKHDGFVWIERKHYFKPELNPRFFLRQKTSGPN